MPRLRETDETVETDERGRGRRWYDRRSFKLTHLHGFWSSGWCGECAETAPRDWRRNGGNGKRTAC